MITLLSKIFIKNNKNYEDGAVRRAYGILCSIVGIALNVILFAAKFVIGLITASVSVQADSFNNLSDAGSSILSMLGFRLAGRKPTDANPFGSGRIEYVASLIIASIVMMMGVSVMKDSIVGIIEGNNSTFSIVAVAVLCASIVVKAYMACYNTIIGHKINSQTMKAVATDSISDVVSTFVVLVSLVVYKITGFNPDNYCGIAVSLFIIWTGFCSAKETVSTLLGKSPDKELVNKIYTIVMGFDGIVGVHDLVVHDYGPGRLMISLHAEVSGDIDIYTLHETIDSAMAALDKELGCISVIHMDPICLNDKLTMEKKQEVLDALRKFDERITIHDFRMVVGPSRTNVLFDAVIPHDLKMSDEEAKAALTKIVEDKFENTHAIIQVDKSFC